MSEKKSLFKNVFVATLIFYVVIHGYRMTHNMYSFDSLLMIYQNDYGWQIALGRYVIPALIFLRGSICNPWLISVCTVLFNVLTVYFVCRLFSVQDRLSIVLIAGVLVCNPTAIAMNASYLMDVDFYALACLLSVLCVYFFRQAVSEIQCRNYKYGCIYFLLSIVSLAVTLGIYQAYLCMAVGLFLMCVLDDLLEDRQVWKTFKYALCMFGVLLIAGLLYYIGWKAAQEVFGIWTANSYNGLDSVGDYSQTSLFGEIIESYRRVFQYFANPDVFTSISFSGKSFSFVWKYIVLLSNVSIVVYGLFKIIRNIISKKLTITNILFQLLVLVVFPFGINVVCFISKGMEHTLMVYAFNLVYVLAILVCKSDIRKLFVVPFVMIIWTDIVFANQVYLKKELLYESAGSLLTRIVADVEEVEGYIPGETQVAIYGNYEFSDNIPEIPGFEEVVCYGMGKTGLSYIDLDYAYLRYILCVDMNLTRVDSADSAKMEIIEAMPCYPQIGSVAMVEDTIVVKISDY